MIVWIKELQKKFILCIDLCNSINKSDSKTKFESDLFYSSYSSRRLC